ncbi:hypothetical protein HK101_004317 [Irineochytrium annulatum]|nr:hypothetical protein HK101_004317 [Irineochytrium annulatum]
MDDAGHSRIRLLNGRKAKADFTTFLSWKMHALARATTKKVGDDLMADPHVRRDETLNAFTKRQDTNRQVYGVIHETLDEDVGIEVITSSAEIFRHPDRPTAYELLGYLDREYGGLGNQQVIGQREMEFNLARYTATIWKTTTPLQFLKLQATRYRNLIRVGSTVSIQTPAQYF